MPYRPDLPSLATRADFIPQSIRLSQRASRRYEDQICVILDAYPSATYIRPRHVRPVTFCNGIRDAMKAFLTNPHWPTRFNFERLFEVRPKIIFSYDQDLVRIGPPLEKSEKAKGDHVLPQLDTIIDASHPGVAEALCCLFHYGYIKHPIDVRNFDDALEPLLSDKYPNVAFFRQSPDVMRIA